MPAPVTVIKEEKARILLREVLLCLNRHKADNYVTPLAEHRFAVS